MQALQNPTTNVTFEKINDTHHRELINLVELFNIITKGSDQQSTNRNNVQRCAVEIEPYQDCAQITI